MTDPNCPHASLVSSNTDIADSWMSSTIYLGPDRLCWSMTYVNGDLFTDCNPIGENFAMLKLSEISK